MPLYAYTCPEGHVLEDIRPVADRHAPTTCECGRLMTMKVFPVPTVGLVFSNAITTVDGKVLSSNSEQRAYEAAHGVRHIDTRSDEWRMLRDSTEEAATQMVNRMGYQDTKEFQAKVHADRATYANDMKSTMS